MAFCIPKHLVKKLLEGADNGEIDVKKLYMMTSPERRTVFERYVDKETAKGINAGFEQAMASTQRNAMAGWVKNTFIGKVAKARTDIYDKIINLKETGVLDPTAEENFLGDLVAQRLGISVTADEAKEISRRATLLDNAAKGEKDKFGLPPIEYFKEKQAMEKYLQSLNPTHDIKVLTSVAGRGALLLSLKSPITNIVGNTVQAIENSFERRIISGQYAGKVDKNIIKEYWKKSKEVYAAGHFDLSRADGYSDGAKTLGEMITHSQGKGIIRKIGRFYEDVVYDKLMGRPDVEFARVTFIDSANLAATKVARLEGLGGEDLVKRATQLFIDAATPSATTPEGMLVREEAKAEALFATFQNKSSMAEISLGARALIDKATGDIRLGEQIVPFAKTPANVVSMTLDAGGLGIIKGTYALLQGAVKEYQQGNPEPMRKAARYYLRAGLGMLIAFVLSQLIKPDDFVGMYPTNKSEQELLKAKHGNGNMIRVGGKWISLDYFGFLGSPLVGFLYAKKYGKDFASVLYSYIAGAGLQVTRVPGLQEVNNLTSSLLALKPDEYESWSTKAQSAVVSLLDQIRARVVPVSADLAKAFDDTQRQVDPTSLTDKLKASIPGLRNTLPAATDVFGEVLKGEPWWSVVLFGARVSTANQTEVTDELTRLDNAGQLPTLTRPEKTSTRFKDLNTQLGDVKFAQAMMYFRSLYYTNTLKEIRSNQYKKLKDEDKKNALNTIKSDAEDKTLSHYHYKKPKKD